MMDSLFFLASKTAWLLLSPASLLLLMLAAGLACLFAGRRGRAGVLLATPTLAFLLIALLPMDEWLAWPLESCFPANPALPARADGVILLGGAILGRESTQWEQVELSSAAERILGFLTLARRYPEATLVFTGGSGEVLQQDIKEADIARRLFETLELDVRRVIFERESRNTYENAVNTKALVMPDVSETWILVTSAAHMPRAAGVFNALDWPVLPYPVDHGTSPRNLWRLEFDFSGNLDAFTGALREWAGLVVYYLSGRTTSLLPPSCAGKGAG